MMKKNLVPLFALLLAVGASAFTQATTKSSQALFWYDAETLEPLNGGVATESIPSGCDRINTIDCAYGFTSAQQNPNPANAQDRVTKP
jgi:hypothetical protein